MALNRLNLPTGRLQTLKENRQKLRVVSRSEATSFRCKVLGGFWPKSAIWRFSPKWYRRRLVEKTAKNRNVFRVFSDTRFHFFVAKR